MLQSNYRVVLGGVGALVITLVLAASSWAMAPSGRHADPERMLDRMTHKLDLTQEQQSEIGALLNASSAAIKVDTDRARVLRQTLRDQRKDFDAGSAQAAADELGQLTGRIVFARTSTRAQVYGLLTPEQQASMDEWAEKRNLRKHHKRMHRLGM